MGAGGGQAAGDKVQRGQEAQFGPLDFPIACPLVPACSAAAVRGYI